MIRMMTMMMNRSGTTAARGAQHPYGAAIARKALGLAIVSSGFAVIAAHGLQHAFGG